MQTLAPTIELIRQLEPIAADRGYHFGLTGSVLFKGESEKDADLILYPHKEEGRMSPVSFVDFIASMGFDWNGASHPEYTRRVYVCERNGLRFDIFHFNSSKQ